MNAVACDPSPPWDGRPSPCGNLPHRRRLGLEPVSFPDLADCRECLMCGGCEVHEGCLTDLHHIEWHLMFASPGEPACGEAGAVAGRGYTCALPSGHRGGWHMARGGSGWRMARKAASRG